MDKYVFYYRGDEVQALPKTTLSKRLKAELLESGFKKHPLEVQAESQQRALRELQRDNELNLRALGDFAGHNVILAAIFIPSFMVIVIALFFYG